MVAWGRYCWDGSEFTNYLILIKIYLIEIEAFLIIWKSTFIIKMGQTFFSLFLLLISLDKIQLLIKPYF